MVRTATGKMVPAQTSFNTTPTNRKFLLVLQYWEGDKQEAEDLGDLIADLERIRNRDVDVLIFARADAPAFSQTTRDRLASKFGQVMFERCRRRDGRGYPFGANSMFYDMVARFGQERTWSDRYFAFINLESDVCPLHPGWIGELIRAFRDAEAVNCSATGHIQDNPIRHMNGVGVYAIDIWNRVGSQKLNGGNPQVAFDIFHAKNLLPHCTPTPFIVLDFKRPTISSDELFNPVRGLEPAIYHGVKDASAREAVRARHISLTNERDGAKKTVFTYVVLADNQSKSEETKKLELWREGWRSRGWNPIALGIRDAAKNGAFKRMEAHVGNLPYVGNGDTAKNRFYRWLALDSMGGGMMVDLDVLPGQFTPSDVIRRDAGIVLAKPDMRGISAAFMDKATVGRFVEQIIGYDTQVEDLVDGKANVSDLTVWTKIKDSVIEPTVFEYGEKGYQQAKLVQFSDEAVMRVTHGDKPVAAMERYLRGN